MNLDIGLNSTVVKHLIVSGSISPAGNIL